MHLRDRETPDVTDAELRVLIALWDLGPSTIRKLTEKIYPGGGQSAYATVQKLLERLEQSSPPFVARDRSAMTHVFVAAVKRDDFIGSQLRSVAERLCEGSFTPLLTHLVKTEALSDADRNELRRLLNANRPRGN